jgi:hypothetical protein
MMGVLLKIESIHFTAHIIVVCIHLVVRTSFLQTNGVVISPLKMTSDKDLISCINLLSLSNLYFWNVITFKSRNVVIKNLQAHP